MESKHEEQLEEKDEMASLQEQISKKQVPENLVNTKQQLLEEAGVDEGVQKVYEWAVSLMMKEKERLKGLGVEPIDLQVVDMSVLVEGKKKQINRVIFNSLLDFSQVTNILIS